MATLDSPILEADATAQALLVAKGEVTAAELLESAIARTDAAATTLNAVPVRFDDVARAQIAAAGGRPAGPFGGVPFLLKDLGQDFAGQPNTRGAKAFRNYRPAAHSAFTRRCLEAGLVIFGRTATPELGLKAVTESKLHGPTRNPWDTTRTAGGSSGGSAAAVAGSLVAMAGASDGGGSIRIPASFCGLFGLKPSTGRISAAPAAPGWEGASSNGVLTRSVRDTARMLDVLCGHEPGDLYILPPPARTYAAELALPPGRLRIAYSTVSPVGTPVEPANVRAVEDAARLLDRLGHVVEQAAPAIDGAAVAACYITLYLGQVAAEVAASGAGTSAFEPETAMLAELGRALSAGAYVRQHVQWNGFARALGAFHQRHDFWLLPTVAAPPARIGALDTPPRQLRLIEGFRRLRAGSLMLRLGLLERMSRDALAATPFTQLANLTHVPAMSVPFGTAPAEPGGPMLPVGVQFVGAHGSEGTMLRLAAQLEAEAPWHGPEA